MDANIGLPRRNRFFRGRLSWINCHNPDTERGVPRSESKISMIASVNHTIILTQWCYDCHPANARIVGGDSPQKKGNSASN